MKKEVKIGLATLGLLAAGVAAKASVDYMDQNLTPKYETRGYAPPIPDETPEWVRPVNWTKKTNYRITIIDGRDGKQYGTP